MKILFYLSLLLFFTACNNGPANQQSHQSSDTAKISSANDQERPQKLSSVEDIQKEYASVISEMKNGSLDSVVYRYDCSGERSGTVTRYTRKGELRMIKHRYNEYSHFSAIDQYFVKDSSLFFIFLDQVSWSFDSDASESGGTKDNITEKRIYIIDDQPLKCLVKKYVIRSSATENPSSSSVPSKEVKCVAFQAESATYKKLLKYIESDKHDCLEKD